jgi:hypothetical protein
MTTLHPATPPPSRERQFVMAYGLCRIWRLLEGPNRGASVVTATDPPHPEW